MSYVNKKTRVFKDAGDADVMRKRSEGRMKTYHSALDARAWSNDTEERRQYILELVRQQGKSLGGKIIPLEGLINILMADKNATILRLQKEIDLLRNFINSLGLSPEQLRRLNDLENALTREVDDLGEIEIGGIQSDEFEKGAGESVGKEGGLSGEDGLSGGGLSGEGAGSGLGIGGGMVRISELDSASPSTVAAEAVGQLENIRDICREGSEGMYFNEDIPPENLRARLDNLRGLEGEVRNLKRTAQRCEEMGKQLGSQAGDVAELERLRNASKNNCKDASKAREEICCLMAQLRSKEQEIEQLRCKCKELEVITVERNCLKMRIDDLKRIQVEYEELLKKTKGFDQIKKHYEELLLMEEECNALKDKMKLVDDLESERNSLLNEVEKCECYIANQDEEIKRLVCHVDCLAQGRDEQQDRMKTTLVTMRAKLDKKDDLIAASEQKLADVQVKLKDSIEAVACETFCLKDYIKELETRLGQTDERLTEATNNLDSKMAEVNNIKAEIKRKDEMIAKLNQQIKELEQKETGDEHSRQLLKLSKCAIVRVTEILEKHLEDEQQQQQQNIVEKQDTEGVDSENKMKNLELELQKSKERIEELEETTSVLQEDALSVELENKELRKLSTELQEMAKEKFSELTTEIATKEQSMHEMIDSVKQQGEDLVNLKEENERLRIRIGELEHEIEELKYKNENNVGQTVIRQQSERILEQNDDLNNCKKLLEEEKRLRLEAESMAGDLKNQIQSLQSKEAAPSAVPSVAPSAAPSAVPSVAPSAAPSAVPSVAPSAAPSAVPSAAPSAVPSAMPSVAPSAVPSAAPPAAPPAEPSRPLDSKTIDDDGISSLASEAPPKEAPKPKRPSKAQDDAMKLADNLQEQVRKLSKSTENKRRRSSTASNVVNDLKKKLEDEAKKLQECEEKLKASQDGGRLSELESENNELKKKLASLQSGGGSAKGSIGVPEAVESDNVDELRETVRRLTAELERQKKDCDNMMASLKGQYERDVKSVSNKSKQSIDKLLKSHESVLEEANRMHETEISSMDRRRPSLSKKTFEVCSCRKAGPQLLPPPPPPDPTPETSVVCSCAAKQMMKFNEEGMNKQQSMLQKIRDVEEKLKFQQEKFTTKVKTLQNVVEKFRDDLEAEKQKNNDLLDRMHNKKLNQNIEVERRQVNQLSNLLNRKDNRCACRSQRSQSEPYYADTPSPKSCQCSKK